MTNGRSTPLDEAFPEFFARVPRITLHDPLAALLGAPPDGLLHFGYADAVRFVGHSCPTVALAYSAALKDLLQRALGARAEDPERAALAAAWQGRVARILLDSFAAEEHVRLRH